MTEQIIELDLINKLSELKYVYRDDIRDKASLELNFRAKFEELNRVKLTDGEFSRVLDKIITPDVFLAAKTLREVNGFDRDDGTPLNYTLVNTKDWCKNTFEVINQLRINTDNSHHRYDVILLINGVPCVQIELKTLTITPRRAMQQIVDYKNDLGNGYGRTLMCFIQLFIVSNRNNTYYFANNNKRHFSFDADEKFLPIYQFADEKNKKITHLDSFAEKFLAKCTLGQMISRYMVLVALEQKLLMMRPYQIYAVKAIVDCIHQGTGNGYIWHTTGSGKTLTSFKAATLLKDNSNIEKCLFVVDRKDLDRQTREEFNRFQEGCVEANTNTENLVRRLLSDDYADKVIVTTIQKLGLALNENSKRNKAKLKYGKETYAKRLEPLSNKRMAIIFDECHRSQFGDNHEAIKEFFPNSQLFGFTGTPIFPENSTVKRAKGDEGYWVTTEDIFQKQLHAYTITNAIEDQNVLKFHIDYYETQGANAPAAGEPLAKKAIIEAILEKHDSATNQRKFNAILATASINDAIEYFRLFKTIQAEKFSENPDFQPLNIACVFSPPAFENKDANDEATIPKEQLQGFKGVYIELAQQFRKKQESKNTVIEVAQLDFEFVLFASAIVDYDYIMQLIAKYSAQKPSKRSMSREQLIGLILSDAKFMDEREEITSYIYTLKQGEGLSEKEIRDGYAKLNAQNLQAFVDFILRRMIFDGDQLSDLLAPLNLGWKARTQKELDLVKDLSPLLHKLSVGREISGLSAYEK